MAQCITSRENDTVKRICKLRDSGALRQESGTFLAEGVRLCTDLAAVISPLEVYYTRRALDGCSALAQMSGEHTEINDSVAQKLSDTKSPQGVFCVFPRCFGSLSDIGSGTRWLVLERVQNPDNVGALLRSAAAFGFAGTILCDHCADPWSPKAVRASMGCVAKQTLIVCETVPKAAEALRDAGIALMAAALQDSVPLAQAIVSETGVAVLIGNEAGGLSAAAVDAADYAVRIPMADGVESLNAAVAGSILLWHFRGV